MFYDYYSFLTVLPSGGLGALPVNIRYHQVQRSHHCDQITNLASSCHVIQLHLGLKIRVNET